MDQAYGGPFGGANRPTAAQKVDLVVGVDSASQMEGQVQVQQGGWRASTDGRTLFGQGLVPSRIGTEAGGAANRRVLLGDLAVQDSLRGGVIADMLVSQDGHQTLLEGAETPFDLAFGLRAGRDQVGHAQGGESALELRRRLAVIGHGIVAKEAQAVGVDDQRQGVLAKEAAEMLEVIPSGVCGHKSRAQEFAGMIIDGQEQSLLGWAGPPLVDGGIMLPQLAEAGTFPPAADLGPRFRLAKQVGKMGAHIGRDRLPVTLETEAPGQLIGDPLKVGRLLPRDKIQQKLAGCRWPDWPMASARRVGTECSAIQEPAGAEAIEVGLADLQVLAGFRPINQPIVKLLENVLEKGAGQAFGQLIFFTVESGAGRVPGSRGFVGLRFAPASSPPRPRDPSPRGILRSPFELSAFSF